MATDRVVGRIVDRQKDRLTCRDALMHIISLYTQNTLFTVFPLSVVWLIFWSTKWIVSNCTHPHANRQTEVCTRCTLIALPKCKTLIPCVMLIWLDNDDSNNNNINNGINNNNNNYNDINIDNNIKNNNIGNNNSNNTFKKVTLMTFCDIKFKSYYSTLKWLPRTVAMLAVTANDVGFLFLYIFGVEQMLC